MTSRHLEAETSGLIVSRGWCLVSGLVMGVGPASWDLHMWTWECTGEPEKLAHRDTITRGQLNRRDRDGRVVSVVLCHVCCDLFSWPLTLMGYCVTRRDHRLWHGRGENTSLPHLWDTRGHVNFNQMFCVFVVFASLDFLVGHEMDSLGWVTDETGLRANFDEALIGVFNRICHDFFHGNLRPRRLSHESKEDKPGFLFLN